MCNNLKNGSRVYKIPEWGFGYKVFDRNGSGGATAKSVVHGANFPKNKWIVWNNDDSLWDEDVRNGFCFLLNSRAVKEWTVEHFEVVYRIRYRKGLGKRSEGYYMSSLCKEFKILKEVDIKDLK